MPIPAELAMFARFRSWSYAALLLICCSGSADAAWVTFKNDTSESVVVQEITIVNGQVKRGKPATLLPGESLREFVPGPTVKKIEIFDAQKPDQKLWSGNLGCKEDTQSFSISESGGRVTVRPVAASSAPPKK
jgi:hypothetical protein